MAVTDAARAQQLLETSLHRDVRGRLKLAALVGSVLIFYILCWRLAQVDPVRLVSGLPKLAHWLAQAWPPQFDELPLFTLRIAETVAMAAIGTGAILAALNVSYRDFKFVLPFFMQLWFFATPSIFMDIGDISNRSDMQQMSTWLPWLLSMNPMVVLIATFRDSILGQPVDWLRCGGAATIAFGVLIFGCSYFRWVEHKFADII